MKEKLYTFFEEAFDVGAAVFTGAFLGDFTGERLLLPKVPACALSGL